MSSGESPRWGVAVDSPTEERNPRTVDLDVGDTLELLRLINAEDQRVPDAVAAAPPALARPADVAAERARAGGTGHYVGAGTSGRTGGACAAGLPRTLR